MRQPTHRIRRLLGSIACALLIMAGYGRSAAAELPSQLLLKDIAPGPANSDPQSLVSMGGLAFFTAAVPDSGRELWVSDGTEAGTRLVRDLAPGPDNANITAIAALDGRVLFLRTLEAGFELWQSDGTEAGTTQIVAVAGQYVGSSIALHAGKAYFSTQNHPFFSNPLRLWQSDGTPANTQSVAEFRHGGLQGSMSPFSAGGHLYVWIGLSFGLNDGSHSLHHVNGATLTEVSSCGYGTEVYSCGVSGTWEHGVVTVLDETPHLRFVQGTATSDLDLSSLGIARLGEMKALGQQLLFFATSAEGNLDLWRTDGTLAGTQIVLRGGPAIAVSAGNLTPAHGVMYYRVISGTPSAQSPQLWQTDGTEAGTRRVMHLASPGPQPASWSTNLRAVGSRLIFVANDDVHGYELWQIAGAGAAPAMIHDVRPGPYGSFTERWLEVVELGGGLLWPASDGAAGYEPRYLAPGFAPYAHAAWAGGPAGGVATAPLELGNRGAASQPLTVTLALPEGVSLAHHTLGVTPTIAGGTAQWRLGGLATGDRLELLGFRLPDAPLGTAFTATLSLEPGGIQVPIRLEIAHQLYLPAVHGVTR